jgi:hypothetical protein
MNLISAGGGEHRGHRQDQGRSISSGSPVRAASEVDVEDQGNVAKENLTRIVLPR